MRLFSLPARPDRGGDGAQRRGAAVHREDPPARVGRALRGFFHPAADYEILWDITRLPALRPMLGHVPDAARRAQVARVIDRFSPGSPILPACGPR